MRIKVMPLAPQLETQLMTTQQIMEESPEERSTRDQEKKLEELEVQKQKLQTMLDTLPLTETDNEEAVSLGQRGKDQLAQLGDRINKLGQVLGRKMAAAAQFSAARTETLAQLEELNKKMAQETAQLQKSEQSLDALPAAAATLAEQKQRLAQLQAKLDSEAAYEQLDEENKQQLNQLKKTIEVASRKVETTRKQLEVNEVHK